MLLTQSDRLNRAVGSLHVEKRVQIAKMPNKMTECIFNALAFLFVVNLQCLDTLRLCVKNIINFEGGQESHVYPLG